jgi:signal transduction histidine kinase
MTLRLVAVMSIVLLLSLGAFGLLAQHYQDQLMAEVGRTASAVGRATLQTFVWQDGAKPYAPPVGLPGEPSWGDDDVVEVHRAAAAGADAAVKGIEEHSFERVVVVRHVAASTAGDAVCDAGITAQDDRPEPGPGFFIDVQDVRAETDPSRGLILKFPQVAFRHGEPATGEKIDGPGAPSGGEVVFARSQAIEMPVPLGSYRELFDTVRRRSLLLALGVFAVGVALSAGLAARFTRPIRRLDAAIHRLTAGDLDVAVEARGRDEIGRLARAFNEMARRLRANRDREREIVRREKLSALGRLAAGVAHDVRNPLHSIGLTLQHLRETACPESDERRSEFDRSVEIIRGEIRRLDHLVGNFLRFAKSEQDVHRPVDLAELVRDVARLVQKEAERRRVEVVLDLAASPPTVNANGESVRSALLNLVLNALEAMPRGGRLTLALRPEGSGHVLLEVADTGEGIPEEEQERVFEFAYTTRESGNGLGLAIVHHCIVEEHGGRVSLDSRPGAGTRVRVMLPVRSEAAA